MKKLKPTDMMQFYLPQHYKCISIAFNNKQIHFYFTDDLSTQRSISANYIKRSYPNILISIQHQEASTYAWSQENTRKKYTCSMLPINYTRKKYRCSMLPINYKLKKLGQYAEHGASKKHITLSSE